MNHHLLSVTALGFAIALAGCTSGNTGVPPDQKTANLSANVLQFAVGTANIAGTLGLNTVVTYRQPNGLSGTLLNTPVITGPAGFANTGSAASSNCAGAGIDAGTNRMSGQPQPLLGTAAAASTFGTAGGAFSYGFQPNNSTTGGGVSFARYALPCFSATTTQYIGGPPAFPQVRDGNSPSGFQGFAMGFTDFALTPVTGTYSLTLTVPTGFDSNGNATFTTVSANGNLGSLTMLPTIAAPTFAFDGVGGGSIGVTIPPGVTEAYAIVRDGGGGSCFPASQSPPVYYTVRTTTAGPQTLTLPSNLGPTIGTGSTRSICSGDTVRVYVVGFDYPANAANPAFNSSQNPPISGANGQADITTSAFTTVTSP